MAQSHRGPPPHETEEEKRQRAAREEAEAREAAEAATAHLPRQGEQRTPAMTAAEAAPGERTVKMDFPHPVTLTLSGYRMVRFGSGVQDVPVSMVDEPYLKDSGVTKV